MLTGAGCRIGELLLTMEYNDETCHKWADTLLTSLDGIPALSKAVVKLRLRQPEGQKGADTKWDECGKAALRAAAKELDIYVHGRDKKEDIAEKLIS